VSLSVIQPCPLQPDDDDPCKQLAKEIDELVNRDKRQDCVGGRHGLKHRFREQIEGANGPPSSGVGDTNVWNNHDEEIKNQQKGLRDRLNDFNKNNCGDRVPVIDDAWEWATKPAPKPSEWKGPTSLPDAPEFSADPGFLEKMSKQTGLKGLALLIFIILSEGSRVFLPRNALPIP
jgi:hypothetical protein